jgi:hypothetical protein
MFLPVSWLTLQGFSSRFISGMLDTFTTNATSLVVLSLQVRALYVKAYVCVRLYLESHWRDFPEIHTACVLHFRTGIEGLASPYGCLISRHQLDKWPGACKSQTGCDKSEKSCPCPKSKHVIQPQPKQFMTISNPKMKLTFLPQYYYSSKASNINLKPKKHDISRIYLEQQ